MHLLIQYAANSLFSQRYTMEKKIDEIKAYFNSRVSAGRYKQTTRSSLADIDETEYQLLYEFITSDIFYSKKVELLKQLLKHYQDRKSLNSPLPILFRQAIYLLAYDLCKGDYYDIAQQKALKDVGLSHNMFTKWQMNPKNDYCLDTYYNSKLPLSMPLYYQGKKNYMLVHLVGELSKQVSYKRFVDVFTGSGTVTLGIPKSSKNSYYMNDINVERTNLIDIIRKDDKQFLNLLSELMNKIKYFPKETIPDSFLQELFFPHFSQITNWQIIALGIPKKVDFSISAERDINFVRKYIEENPKDMQVTYAKGIKKYFKNFHSHNAVQLAIATAYQDSFSSRTQMQSSYLNTFFKTLPKWKQVITEFKSYNIATLNEFDYQVVRKFNSEDTLLYMDSPYAGTAGYKNIKYSIKDIQKLCDTLKEFRGKWIFSCRAGITYVSPKEDEDISLEINYKMIRKVDAIREVLDMYKPLSPNVAFIRPSDDSDESYLSHIADSKEVMFFNFQATAPDFRTFYDYLHKILKIPATSIRFKRTSVYRIISYTEFYPLAQKGLDGIDGTSC